VLWPELALRAAGLRFDEAGVIFGIWAPIAARDDPDFFWTLPPERSEVNVEGFPGPEFVIPKPAGVCRMLFFGESCTQQGFPRGGEARLSADLPEPLDLPRVSEAECRENLAAIGDLVTRAESSLASWRAYNEVVRKLSRERGRPSLDLAALADEAPDPDAIFLADGIHFTPQGLAWIADRISREIERLLAEDGAAAAGRR